MALLYGWQSLFAAVIALFQRQRVDATILAGWDESAVLLGIALMTELASSVAG